MSKAIFLDRDGVINDISNGFVNKPEDLVIIPGVKEALEIFKSNGYMVFVVTNQGGIEKGFMTEAELHSIHNRMINIIGFKFNGINHCPHYDTECSCRKPKTGMIDYFCNKFKIDRKKSFMIGDMESDILCGCNSYIKSIKIGEPHELAIKNCKDLLEAAKYIESRDL